MTVRDLIRRALRKLGALASGRDPKANEAQDALESLQALYMELLALGVFGALRDAYVGSAGDYVARPGQRITNFDPAQAIITLPVPGDPDVQDGTYVGWDYGFDHCDADHQLRDGRAIVLINQLTDEQAAYVYDGMSSTWVNIGILNLDDVAPLYTRYGDGLACVLAIRLADEYGQSPGPGTVQGARNFNISISQRNDTYRHVGSDNYS